MLRAAVWTVGLFAGGAGVVQLFPGPWIEPVVLAALGAGLIFAAGRPSAVTRATNGAAAAAKLEPAERAAR